MNLQKTKRRINALIVAVCVLLVFIIGVLLLTAYKLNQMAQTEQHKAK